MTDSFRSSMMSLKYGKDVRAGHNNNTKTTVKNNNTRNQSQLSNMSNHFTTVGRIRHTTRTCCEIQEDRMTTVLNTGVRGGAPPSLMAGWVLLRQMPDCTCLRRSRCLVLHRRRRCCHWLISVPPPKVKARGLSTPEGGTQYPRALA